MKTKKLLSAICAAAVLLSSLAGGIILTAPYSAHAEELIPDVSVTDGVADETPSELPAESETDENIIYPNSDAVSDTEPAETEELITPPNFRYDETNGFFKWDEVKAAYGYCLKTTLNGYEQWFRYYETYAELDRLCYENNMDFGEYEFSLCAFDKEGTDSEWSEPVTVSYSPSFDMPQNVRLDEEYDETVIWDEVAGTARYNIRFYNEENASSLYTNTYVSYNSITYKHYLSDTGNYWISVQAMDKDYNASKWTEPLLIPHTASTNLEPPQNVRFDESGENILWDAVEGAAYYGVQIYGNFDGCNFTYYKWDNAQDTVFENWKSLTCPRTNEEYQIYIYAYSDQENVSSSVSLEPLKATFNPILDGTINIPESIRIEESHIKWEDVEGAYKYWLCISAENNMLLEDEWHEITKDYNYGVNVANRLPAGNYKAEMFVIDENYNYNSKSYDLTLDTVHDETVWVPNLFYKFNEILWDYDRLRHDNTYYFWYRIRNDKDGSLVKLAKSWSEHIYDLPDLSNGDYIIDACVYENNDKIGVWSEPRHITIHGDGYFDKENESTTEVETPPEAADIPEEDRITTITINPAFNMKNKHDENVELDLTKIKIKAKEIYDEEGLKRAEEALGEEIKGNTHYNLLDLTLLYDGEDFSNGYEGLVQVVIPIPAGHRDKTFSCFRLTQVDGKTVKEVIPGEQTEDSYIIYLEHFSEYALVGAGEEEEHTHTFGEEWKNDETGHWKECKCGEKSEEAKHAFGEWKTTKEPTEKEEGSRERACTVCGYKELETLPVIDHAHKFGDWKSDDNSHWKECECGEKSEEAKHAFGEWKTTKEPTEKEEGSRERVCTVCAFKEVETLPVIDHAHKFGDWMSDDNSHWKECECGEKSEEAEHTFGEWKITKEPTEKEEGEETRKCEICGKTETRAVEKLPPAVTEKPPVTTANYGFSVPETAQTSAEETTSAPAAATSVTDEKAGVKVEFAENAVKQGAALNVIVGETTETYAVFDITLVYNNAPIQPYGTLTITIKCPESLKGGAYYVYRAETDGTYTDMGAVFSDGAVTFKTGHLSKYVISTVKLNEASVTAEEISLAPESAVNTENNLNTETEANASQNVPSDIPAAEGNNSFSANEEDKNQNTGVALALIPAAAAALGIIIFKKKK